MHKMAAISALVFLSAMVVVTSGNSFGASISSTRCNNDPNRGELNNPCVSLYDAVCTGSYCRCGSGFEEDPSLHRCVRGSGPSGGQPTGDAFDDLPFDYVPSNQPTGRPLAPATRGDVSNTGCSALNDPCPSQFGAVCGGNYCVCPPGTRHHPSLAQCDPISGTNAGHGGGGGGFRVVPHDHDDHDDHDDDDDNGWGFGGASTLHNSFIGLSAALAAVAVASLLM